MSPEPNPTVPPLKPSRRTGRIARLPKEIRWRINEMLDDGLPYLEIIRQLGEHGKDLNEDVLHRWKNGGYQDHIREQRLLDQTAARRERALTLLAQAGHINGFQATQQIATSQICEAVAELGGDVLREALIANPLNYFRMLNSFARLTNGGLKCEHHLAETAERQLKLQWQNSKTSKKGISRKAVKEMQDKLKLM